MTRPRYGSHHALLSWNDDAVTPLSLTTVRRLTLVALVGYSLGRLLNHGFGNDHFLGAVVGNIVGIAAIFAMFLALGSRANRLFLEDETKLDEYQRTRRNAALHGAYTILAALLILCGTYVQIGSDWGWPMPRDRDLVGDLAFGAVLLALLLPVTILAWTLDLSEDPDADEGEEA